MNEEKTVNLKDLIDLENTLYPNLAQFVKFGSTSISSIADHAGVTVPLMMKVLTSKEPLLKPEFYGISAMFRLNKVEVPVSVLSCSKRIMIDKTSRKHRKMIDDLISEWNTVKNYDPDHGFSRAAKTRIDAIQRDFAVRPIFYVSYLAALIELDYVRIHRSYMEYKKSKRTVSTSTGF